MKRLFLTIFCAAILASNAFAIDYTEIQSIEASVAQQKAAHTLANAARVLGYSEDSELIQTAQAHWWEAQEHIDWHREDVRKSCYDFFRNQMGLSHAAAIGILANIHVESMFDWTHDGTMGYGLVQWCGARQTAARNFAKAQNSELAGQLLYIQYELQTTYSDVLIKLCNVEDSADGAWRAAYEFCIGFERPLNAHKQGRYRGSIACDIWEEMK